MKTLKIATTLMALALSLIGTSALADPCTPGDAIILMDERVEMRPGVQTYPVEPVHGGAFMGTGGFGVFHPRQEVRLKYQELGYKSGDKLVIIDTGIQGRISDLIDEGAIAFPFAICI